MKKLLLFLFAIIISANMNAQETAAEKKAAKAKTEKLAKGLSNILKAIEASSI